jgi:hypothetical protein
MYLTQRRPRVRYVEQDERQDDHFVRGLRKGQLSRVRHNPGVAGRRTAKHALGPVGGDDQRSGRGTDEFWY